MMYYATKTGRFANDVSFLRCETKAELIALEELGWERVTREDAAAVIRWVNAENKAWGSGNAFGFHRAADLFDPACRRYTAADFLAEHRAIGDVDAWYHSDMDAQEPAYR